MPARERVPAGMPLRPHQHLRSWLRSGLANRLSPRAPSPPDDARGIHESSGWTAKGSGRGLFRVPASTKPRIVPIPGLAFSPSMRSRNFIPYPKAVDTIEVKHSFAKKKMFIRDYLSGDVFDRRRCGPFAGKPWEW
jgi:hypothetical protein